MARKPFGIVTKTGTHVRQDVLAHYASKVADSRALTDRFEQVYADKGLQPPLYNPETLSRLLEINTYHYRAVKTKARDTAGLGWSLESTSPEASDSEKAELETFFRDHSPSIPMLLDRGQTDYEAVGWGALEMVREGYRIEGPLTALNHLPSHTIRIHQDGKRFAQIRGNRMRWFKAPELDADVHMDTGTIHKPGEIAESHRATELLVWINYTPRSDYYGLPDIMPALGAIHGEMSRRDYNISFFDSYGVPAYAVFITGDFDEGEIDEDGYSEMQKEIESHFRSLSDHPHSTLVLSIPTREDGQQVKVEFVRLAVDIKEASFRLYRQDNRDEVLAAHGVPPYRAGITEVGALGQNVATETTEIYKMSVIEPRQKTLEDLINRYIVRGAFGVKNWRFRLAEIDTRDEQHELDMLVTLVQNGAASPDELRAHFAERFGLEGPAPFALDTGPDIETVERALKRLESDMLEIVRKEGGHVNGYLRV